MNEDDALGPEIRAFIQKPGVEAKKCKPTRDGGKRFCICIPCIWLANGTAFRVIRRTRNGLLEISHGHQKDSGGFWLLIHYCMT